jgi:predicted secreted protein
MRGALRLCALVLLISVWGGAGWCAQLTVQDATLHVGAPADIVAQVIPEGTEVTFDLPRGLVPDSLQATQGETSVPAVLQPVREAGTGAEHERLQRYEARLSGLQPGAPVEVRFGAADLYWKPAMTLRVVNGEGNLQVQGSVTNQALEVAGARLRLVTGQVGGAYGYAGAAGLFASGWDVETYRQAMAELGREYPAAGGLQAVAELEKLELPVGGTRQTPLFSAKVPVTRTYRWDTRPAEPYGGAQPQRAAALYSFRNSSDRALPEGAVSVSEGDALVGSGYMSWTPAGETALVAVPSVQGLSVKRSEATTPQPKTWETEHAVTLRAENSRGEAVTLRVSERVQERWEYGGGQRSRVYQFSEPPQEGQTGVFAWELRVPARGSAEVTYSYRDPIDTTPLRLAQFTADDSPQERAYLVEAPKTSVGMNSRDNRYRSVQAEGYALYRFPMPKGVDRAELVAWIGNAFRVGLAPEVNGKPGAFTVVADAVAINGRTVRDGRSNYTAYYFDLSPYLSATSRAVYFRLDDPTLLPGLRGGAFVRTIEVLRLPEGFPSRAPGYATGLYSGTGPSAGTKRVLHSFNVFTAAEKPFIYEDRGTWRSEVPWLGWVRVADADQRIVYAFSVPPEVSAADCTVWVANQFVLALAKDEGGRPGPFTEALNAIKVFGRKTFFGENTGEWIVDLTPYLQGNPARTAYLAISDADPKDGFGAAISRVEVAVLDEAEKARLERRQHEIKEYMGAQRRVTF